MKILCTSIGTGLFVFFLMTTIIRSEECPGPNSSRITNGNFDFTYESWVKPPEDGGVMFKYGRCVNVLNDQYVRVIWDGANLNGIAMRGSPLLTEYSFLTDETVMIEGKFSYGVNRPPENFTFVNYLVNAAVGWAMVAARVTDIHTAARIGDPIPDDARSLASSAKLNLADNIGKIHTLEINFRSKLNEQGGYTHKLRYKIANKGDKDFAFRNSDISISFYSAFLRGGNILTLLTGEDNFPITNSSGEIEFDSTIPPEDEYVHTTIAITDILIHERKNVVGSFPASFYVRSR